MPQTNLFVFVTTKISTISEQNHNCNYIFAWVLMLSNIKKLASSPNYLVTVS